MLRPRPRIPEGAGFLRLADRLERRCARVSDSFLRTAGKNAPACRKNLGTVLSLLDRMASCWWQCRGGNHIIEYIAGRACSTTKASLSLLRTGYYDEALSLARGVGEISNLFQLFRKDSVSLVEWLKADEAARKRTYSPIKVRLRLEALGSPPLVKLDRYSALSSIGTHVTPRTKPQAHNPAGRGILGGIFQPKGVLLGLNELSVATGILTIHASALLELPPEPLQEVRECAIDLLASVGGVQVVDPNTLFRSGPTRTG